MNKHTPGPWIASRDPGYATYYPTFGWRVAVKVNGSVEDEIQIIAKSTDMNSQANVERIVACVNACGGISTATLNSDGYHAVETLRQQRDELLAALERTKHALELAYTQKPLRDMAETLAEAAQVIDRARGEA